MCCLNRRKAQRKKARNPGILVAPGCVPKSAREVRPRENGADSRGGVMRGKQAEGDVCVTGYGKAHYSFSGMKKNLQGEKKARLH